MFNLDNFTSLGSHGNSNSPNAWTYNTSDTLAEIQTAGYFDNPFVSVQDGDFLYITAGDGEFTGRFAVAGLVIAVVPIVGGGAITGNEVLITKVQDFDNYDDLQITLTPGYTYKVLGVVDVGTRYFEYTGSTALIGNNASTDRLKTASLTPMISGSGNLKQTQLSLESANSDIFNINDTVSSLIVIDNFRCYGSAGTIIGGAGSSIFASLGSFDTTISGLKLGGSFIRIDFYNVFPFGAEIESGEVLVTFLASLTVSERLGVVNSFANIAAGGEGYIFEDIASINSESAIFANNEFTGDGAPVVGLVQADNQAYFKSNVGLSDTISNVSWKIVDNLVPVTITAANTSVVIDTPVIEVTAQRFELITSPNRETYKGARSRAFNINGSFVLETSTNNQRIGVVIKKNGVDSDVFFSAVTAGSAGNRIDNLAVIGSLALAPDDYLEVAVLNETGTADITVLDASFQVVAFN